MSIVKPPSLFRQLVPIALLPVLAGAATAAAQPTRWAPAPFPTSTAKLRQLQVEEIYHYREASYTPPFRIDAQPSSEWRWDTPERAMVARTSAMMNQDYDAFVSAWDPAAREEMLSANRSDPQAKSKRLQQWQDVFTQGRFVLTRRIETGDLVIVTYRVLTMQGEDMGGFEMPVVFRRFEDRWFATQALASDALLLEYPWVSGRDRVEHTVE